MPHNDKVKSHGVFRHFGKWFQKADVWHFNRRAASRAALVGLFFAFVPLPAQMVMALPVCIWLRANLPLTFAFVWITNPITIPPIFYTTYKLGNLFMGLAPIDSDFVMDSAWLWSRMGDIWQPLLLGSLLCGVAFSAVGYTLIDFLWRRHAIKKWQHRSQTRKHKSRPAKK